MSRWYDDPANIRRLEERRHRFWRPGSLTEVRMNQWNTPEGQRQWPRNAEESYRRIFRAARSIQTAWRGHRDRLSANRIYALNQQGALYNPYWLYNRETYGQRVPAMRLTAEQIREIRRTAPNYLTYNTYR